MYLFKIRGRTAGKTCITVYEKQIIHYHNENRLCVNCILYCMIYELLKICEHASYKTIEVDMKNKIILEFYDIYDVIF